MIKKISLFFMSVCLVAGFSNTPVASGENAEEWFKKIEVNGFVSTAYTYNFNRPTNSTNAIRIFDTDDNAFKLDVAELVFQKEADGLGGTGFRIDLNYGFSLPAVEHSSGSAQSDDFDLQQAFVSYIAPIGNGLQIDFGKFITHMGLEVIEGYDGWNYNYSRSILFGWAIPFTHTGVRMSYGFNDVFSAMFMLANGWDNVRENNDGKTVGFQLGINPIKEVSILLNFVGGPEQNGRDQNWRNVFDTVIIFTPTDKLEFQFNSDWGTEDIGLRNNAEWWGLAGVLRYACTDFFSLNFRAEFFSDNDGARTGTPQDLWEFTITPEVQVSSNMVFRMEYRHDDSNANYFLDHARPVSSQDTISMNAMYFF